MILLIYVGDFSYATWVTWRAERWESGVERDAAGIQQGCQAYRAGSGSVGLLLVHGINENPMAWDKMVPRFVDAGFDCRVMRLPGFAEPLPRYAASRSADWVKAFREELVAWHESHDRVFVVAHSLGAAVAIRGLRQDAEGCSGCILLAPAVEVSDARSPLMGTRFWHQVSRGLLFTRTVWTPFPNDARDPQAQARPGRNPFTPTTVIEETFRLMDSLHEGAAPQLPVLLVLSREDRVIDSAAAKDYFANAWRGETTVFWNEQAGHALPYDLGWEQVADHAVNFIHHQVSGETLVEIEGR